MQLDKYSELKGGMKVAVIGRHDASGQNGELLEASLFKILDREAEAHHSVQSEKFRNERLIQAMKSNKIEVWFMVATWDSQFPKVLGAAIELPTVLIHEDEGRLLLSHAKYREDTCFDQNVLRQLVRERPKDKALPEVGLCDYFEQERNRVMMTCDPTGKVQGGRVGEYSSHSGQMIRVMTKMGAMLGIPSQPVMELPGDAPLAFKHWPVKVETLSLKNEVDAGSLDYAFAALWRSEDGKQQVLATFTRAISTFTGETVIRVQFGSAGKAPTSSMTKDITASLLVAGQNEADRKGWRREGEKKSPLDLCRPAMRIHAPDSTKIVGALRKLEAHVRVLGPHPMLPAIMDFSKQSPPAIGTKCNPARPQADIQEAGRKNSAYFELVR